MWVMQREHSGDGCDLSSTLCKYDEEGRVDPGKYLFRAANVWWRCGQYFIIYGTSPLLL